MTKGLTGTATLIFQVICYYYAFSLPTAVQLQYWSGKQLDVRLFLFAYTGIYLIATFPTFIVLYSHLLESISNVAGESVTFSRFFARSWAYLKSYDVPARYRRIKGCKWVSLFPVVMALSKAVTMVFLFMHVFSWDCHHAPEDHALSFEFVPGWVVYCFIVTLLYSIGLLLQVFIKMEYSDYDPQISILQIAETRSLNADKITQLLQFSVVVHCVIEVGVLVLLMMASTTMHLSFLACHQPQRESSQMVAALTGLFIFELASPILCWALYTWELSQHSMTSTVLSVFRLDIFVVGMFLKLMMAWVFPLSLLSNVSILKQTLSAPRTPEEASQKEINLVDEMSNKLVSFQLRDNWEGVDGDVEQIYRENPSICGSVLVFVDRLLKRFTVVYSGLKLLGTIAFTLFANTSYTACSHPGEYHYGSTCNMDYFWTSYLDGQYDDSVFSLSHTDPCLSLCASSSSYPTRINYPPITVPYTPPLPPVPWQCTSEISGECICSNWFTFQFTVILLHVIHYFVQCYFYIRYNYFDPQQNQINCVETYTFAGNNLTLFLTQPSMCFLSAIEAVCIVIVWLEVILNPGANCYGGSLNLYHIQFAVFITFTEVFKANLSTCGKLWKQNAYWWAVWSLIRIDLFVFYGFTLFLQTFFFPFSCVGYFVTHYKKYDLMKVLYASSNDGSGSIVGIDASLTEVLLARADGTNYEESLSYNSSFGDNVDQINSGCHRPQ
jgi:hypothetical protein